MGDKLKITHETMKNADTYIPVATKELLAATIARACVKRTNQIHAYDEKDEIFFDGEYALSPIYCESVSSKARFLMTILNAYYLHTWDDTHPLMCSMEEYDEWAGTHLLNQIERFKSGEYREKAFDMLADYREMEKYLNSAIYSVLREMNDPVRRFMEAIGTMTSAEGIQEAMGSIEDSRKKIEAEKKRQEEIVNGNGGESSDEHGK
jgi:hypothetical protein